MITFQGIYLLFIHISSITWYYQPFFLPFCAFLFQMSEPKAIYNPKQLLVEMHDICRYWLDRCWGCDSCRCRVRGSAMIYFGMLENCFLWNDCLWLRHGFFLTWHAFVIFHRSMLVCLQSCTFASSEVPMEQTVARNPSEFAVIWRQASQFLLLSLCLVLVLDRGNYFKAYILDFVRV